MRAESVPPEQWPETLKQRGFSEPAAVSFANMTKLTLGGQFPSETVAERGTTTLQEYLATQSTKVTPS